MNTETKVLNEILAIQISPYTMIKWELPQGCKDISKATLAYIYWMFCNFPKAETNLAGCWLFITQAYVILWVPFWTAVTKHFYTYIMNFCCCYCYSKLIKSLTSQ